MSDRWTIFTNSMVEVEKLISTFPEGMFLDMDFFLDWIGGSHYKIQSLGYPQKLRIFEYGTGNYYFMENGEMIPFNPKMRINIEKI
jgi:hypothetical protein